MPPSRARSFYFNLQLLTFFFLTFDHSDASSLPKVNIRFGNNEEEMTPCQDESNDNTDPEVEQEEKEDDDKSREDDESKTRPTAFMLEKAKLKAQT